MVKALQFVAVLCTVISMAAAWAHLLELPNKIDLPGEQYLVVQQIYRGWAMLAVVIFAALLATGALAVCLRGQGARFWLTVTACLCIALALVIFFAFTFPVNQATANWTVLPADWEQLRAEWEYSHAAGAVLYLVAVSCLTVAIMGSSAAHRRGAIN